MDNHKTIGYACAYTPLALIHATGFRPYRILPNLDCPDQAGRLLHDNLCPHVKRILDRAMSKQLPDLAGMVFMNSCDAMRRLADAWRVVCPDMATICVDLPTTTSEKDIPVFESELKKLAGTLGDWYGRPLQPENLMESLRLYNELANAFERMRSRVQQGVMRNGAVLLQEAYLQAACTEPQAMLSRLKMLLTEKDQEQKSDMIPMYLFGNVLPDLEAFALFEASGARIVAEDLCTGSRAFAEVKMDFKKPGEMLAAYAKGLLQRQPCARTLCEAQPGKMAEDIVAAARRHQARGVIGYTVKFCDPYIARMPGIRAALKQEGIPFLLLEGDCTVRTMGQQKTRIEAFTEMLR